VLTAFQQVEDYLAAVRIYSDQAVKQERAVKDAKESLDVEMGRYEAGIDPYINVVTTQTTLLSNQQALATVKVNQMTAAVQLITALGGGWDVSQLPNPSQVSQKAGKDAYKLQR